MTVEVAALFFLVGNFSPLAWGLHPSSDYQEARQLLTKHKWEEAAIVLKSVFAKNPEDSAIALELARSLTFSGRREEALSLLGRVAQNKKGNQKKLLIRRSRVLSRLFLTNTTFQSYQDGLNLMLAKKYRAARERFVRAIEQEPENIEILVRLAQCLMLENDPDSAAERLRLAKRLNPYEPEIRLWLGRAFHQRGELDFALDELKSARYELKDSELAPLWYAEALAVSGQLAQAIQVLNEDLKSQPIHVVGLMTLARLKAQSANREAQVLWDARKDLQVAQSRLPQYASTDLLAYEGELGFSLRRSQDEIQTEIQKLLQRVQDRLDELGTDE